VIRPDFNRAIMIDIEGAPDHLGHWVSPVARNR
jgi:hypothetical protein